MGQKVLVELDRSHNLPSDPEQNVLNQTDVQIPANLANVVLSGFRRGNDFVATILASVQG